MEFINPLSLQQRLSYTHCPSRRYGTRTVVPRGEGLETLFFSFFSDQSGLPINLRSFLALAPAGIEVGVDEYR